MIQRQAVAALFVAVGLAVPAVAKDPAADLRGRWLLDKVAALEASAPPFYKMATPEKQKEIREDILKSMPDTVFEFAAGTVSIKTGADTHTATYKITKSEKNTLWFESVSDEKKKDGSASVDKMSAEFVAADTVKLTREGDSTPLLLKRTK